MTETISTIEVYWDSQDPANEGWAYRITFTDGEQESGPYDGLRSNASATELEEAIIEIAYEHGLDISCNAVAAEPHSRGGFALYKSD